MSSAIDYHNKIANEWEARYLSGSFARRSRFFEERILSAIKISGAWADIGCGSGHFARKLADHGAAVVGYDGSAEMVSAAWHSAESGRGSGGSLHFEQIGSVEQLPVADGSLDGCICLSVLEYLPNISVGLGEIARVVKPGGVVVLSIPYRFSLVRLAQAMRTRLSGRAVNAGSQYIAFSRHAVTKRQLVELLAAHGLATENVAGFDPFIPRSLLQLTGPSLFFATARRVDLAGCKDTSVASKSRSCN
ncbi:putative Methyltransferase family protein [Mesorhizobium prunaredense]|uniref:Putative Methyltransferase family protein n=1 Tax=Mesorhizobium prunaredense TaxID=1631249 RepID=A0A1R3VE40_9HYPH|nr:class I SAM-dependent methyltransferase [Mesorhizobium prunaredense]SIT58141.1 putative Methyltransferase family protein [Mesorhizobium prunaredense]